MQKSTRQMTPLDQTLIVGMDTSRKVVGNKGLVCALIIYLMNTHNTTYERAREEGGAYRVVKVYVVGQLTCFITGI